MNKEIKNSNNLKSAIDVLLNHYSKSVNIPIPSELLVKFKDLDTKNPTPLLKLNGGTINEPTVLNYSNNVISPNESNKYFKLPTPITGNTVEIFNETGIDVYILPPNNVSKIDSLNDGESLFISGVEQNFTMKCVKNPVVSIWVSNTSRSSIRVPLGILKVNSTTGADRYWRGNNLSPSTVGVHAGGASSTDSNYTLSPSGDVFVLNIPTTFYQLTGFTVKTNIPIGDNLDMHAGFEYYYVTGLNTTSTTQITPIPRFTDNVWDLFGRFNPSNQEFVRDYIHPTLGLCYMIDVSPTSAGFNPINTSLLSINRVIPSSVQRGQGVFSFAFELDATMPTKLYEFEVDAYIDLSN